MDFNKRGFFLRRQGEIHEKTKRAIIGFLAEATVIGRDETADVQITDVEFTESISRKHLRILIENDDIFVDPTMGKRVIVNGIKIEGRQELKLGDLIGIGRLRPGSNLPAVTYKVEGCIEIASSDEGSDIEESVAEANRKRLCIEDKAFEELAAGLEALPEILHMNDDVQVISDDEEYAKAKSWQQKLMVKGKNSKENFSRSTHPLVRIEKSSSQSSDIVETPAIGEFSRVSSISPAQPHSSGHEEPQLDFYHTYSLQNFPPMRRLEIRIVAITTEEVESYTAQRKAISLANENAAPKKRKPRKKVEKRYHKETAYERVQAVVDSDSMSEDESESDSLSSARSDRDDANNNNVKSQRKDFNQNRLIPAQNFQKKARVAVPQVKRPAAPKMVKRTQANDRRDPQEVSAEAAPHKLTNEFRRQRSAILIDGAAPVPQRKRRMSTADPGPTASSPFKKSRRGTLVSGHRGLELAEDVFSKAHELRAERKDKHEEELLRSAQLPLPEPNKIEYRPMINKVPKRRVSLYVENSLATISASTSKASAAKLRPPVESTDDIKKEKLRKLAESQNRQKTPQVVKKVEGSKPKCKITENSRAAILAETFESSSSTKPPPISSLGRIPRLSERKTSESEATRSGNSVLCQTIQDRLKTFATKFVEPYNDIDDGNNSRANANTPNADGNTSNQDRAEEVAPTTSGSMGFYNPIESPPASRSTDSSDAATPIVICTPDFSLTSILKSVTKKNAKPKTLRFAENFNKQKAYDPDDWDSVPPPLIQPIAMEQAQKTYDPDDWDSVPPPLIQPIAMEQADAPERSPDFSGSAKSCYQPPAVPTSFYRLPSPKASPEKRLLPPTAHVNSSDRLSTEILIDILNWSPDSMILQTNPLKASYESLNEFQRVIEPIIKSKLQKKIRENLAIAIPNGKNLTDPWELLYLKHAGVKKGLTRLVLSTSEQKQVFKVGDFLLIQINNALATDEKFFGHIKGTKIQEPSQQQEVFIDATIDAVKCKGVSVVAVFHVCSISREVISLLTLKTLGSTKIVENMLKPTTITSPAVITQKLFPSRRGLDLSSDQSLIVSTFDKEVGSDWGISVVQAGPGNGKTTTLVESVLQALETAKGRKDGKEPSILVCAKSDAGVERLAKMLLELTKGSGLKIVLNGDDDSEILKPITVPVLAENVPEEFREEGPKYVVNRAAVVVTNIERAYEMFVHGKKFDVCFVDEASQCSELETLITLYVTTKKLVLFGDMMDSRTRFVPKKNTSLFDRICGAFEGSQVTPVLKLHKQFRMRPEIFQFTNKFFFGNVFQSPINMTNQQWPIKPYVVFNTTPITYENNENELILVNLAIVVNQKVPDEKTITIVTTSEAQKAELMTKICYNYRYSFLTMDELASVESDVVILHLSGLKWIDKSPIAALTRARLALIIVGTMPLFEINPAWKGLIADAKQRGCHFNINSTMNQSQIKSYL